jgi:uncharacterized membrane protein
MKIDEPYNFGTFYQKMWFGSGSFRTTVSTMAMKRVIFLASHTTFYDILCAAASVTGLTSSIWLRKYVDYDFVDICW